MNFRKGKLVFSPKYFLICFNDLLGTKVSLKSDFRILSTLRAWEKREEKQEKGERANDSSRTLRSSCGIRHR